MMYAWHFVGATLRDGSPVPDDGVTLRHNGDVELCVSGLHASRRVIDALKYAPGSTLCRVECGGEIIEGNDKLVCSERTIVYRVDAECLLREFARQCALDVIHLWDAPAIVRDYLMTGDEALRGDAVRAARAAYAAAYAAARAAWTARYAAARDAVNAASAARVAWAAAWATWNAARAADAAWAAGWTARDAANAAAWAAEAATWALEAAADAATGNRDANMNEYNEKLEKMVEEIRRC